MAKVFDMARETDKVMKNMSNVFFKNTTDALIKRREQVEKLSPVSDEFKRVFAFHGQLECWDHKQYKGKSPPTNTNCLHCWKVYLTQRDGVNVTGRDLLGVLRAIEVNLERKRSETLDDLAALISSRNDDRD